MSDKRPVEVSAGREEEPRDRKPYEPPVLEELGSMLDLTRGAASSPGDALGGTAAT